MAPTFLASITSVAVELDGVRAAKGMRAPGPGCRACARSTPGAVVRIELRDTSWDELLIGHDDARAVADELAARR